MAVIAGSRRVRRTPFSDGVKGLAYGLRLDVLVDEPDVSPLAEELAARVFGDAVRGLRIEGNLPPCDRVWPIMVQDGQNQIGAVISAAWPPDFETNVDSGMVRMTHWGPKTDVDVETQSGVFPAVMQETFWI